MRFSLLLLAAALLLTSCASEKIYTVKKITDEDNGRASYFLADENGRTIILRQKKSKNLIHGSRIRFEEDV